MALFKKLRESVNERLSVPESKLIGKGVPGKGVVLAVQPGVARDPFGGVRERSVVFTLNVQLEGEEEYRAEVTQVVPDTEYQSVQPGVTTYTIWVDTNDWYNIEIDLNPAVEEDAEAGEDEAGEGGEGGEAGVAGEAGEGGEQES